MSFRVSRLTLGKPLRFLALAVNLLSVQFCCGQETSGGDVKQGAAGVPSPATAIYPLDMVIKPDGKSAYVVDRNLPGVWFWSAGKLEIFAQGAKNFRQPLNAARCLALDKDANLLVGDSSTRDIYRCEAGGKFTPLTGGKIGIPMDIALKNDGTIYVADLETKYLLRIPANSDKVERVAQVNPRGLFVDSKQQVWVVSQNAQQLLIVADDGKTEVIVADRQFDFPHQVVVNSSGEAFVSDGYKKCIWKVVRGSAPTAVVQGPPLDNPVGLAIAEDQVYVVDPRAAKVFRLSPESKLIEWFAIVR